MKNFIIVLLIIILSSCQENRILIDELINKGTQENPIMFYNGKLFSGIGYNIFPNGTLETEQTFEDGKLNGISTEFFVSNEIKKQINYRNNKIVDGTYKVFYENGSLKLETTIINNKQNGLVIEYYDNGKIENKGYYKNGKREGKFQTYYYDGSNRGEIKYKDDLIDGEINLFNNNGTTKSREFYVLGKQEGKQYYYNYNGILEKKNRFKNDILISEILYEDNISIYKKEQLYTLKNKQKKFEDFDEDEIWYSSFDDLPVTGYVDSYIETEFSRYRYFLKEGVFQWVNIYTNKKLIMRFEYENEFNRDNHNWIKQIHYYSNGEIKKVFNRKESIERCFDVNGFYIDCNTLEKY